MVRKIEELRATSDDALIAEHDAKADNTSVGTDYYVEELARRDNARSASRVEALTVEVARLTKVIMWLTIVNALAAVIGAASAVYLLPGLTEHLVGGPVKGTCR